MDTMEADFSIDEMVYNEILKGKSMYHKDGALHVIDYIKFIPDTNQIKVHAVDGESFTCNRTGIFTWEVNTKLVDKRTTKKKNRRKKN